MPEQYQDLVEYIYARTTPAVKLDLKRVRQFLHALGDPQDKLSIVHIAGTNGKGSTAASLAALLQACGYRVGLFTSPHLVRFNERIRINGREVDDEAIRCRLEAWKGLIEKLEITFFEAATALAVDIFAEAGLDYVVLETGLGGRLDATNVVRPRLSVITRIAHDHTRILGGTLLAIAAEKGAIIKPGVPVVVGRNLMRVVYYFMQTAREIGAPFYYAPSHVDLEAGELDLIAGQEIRIPGPSATWTSIHWPLRGPHQVENLTTALAALKVLDPQREVIPWHSAAAHLHWPGRMELISRNPLVFYDVAHNANGLGALLKTLKKADHQQAVLLGGLNRRKKLRPMLRLLRKWGGPVGLFAPQGEFGCTLADYAHLDGSFPHFPHLAAALAWAREPQREPIVIFGSHYMAREVYHGVKQTFQPTPH